MRPNSDFLQEFMLATDALNTINGGMSMSTVSISKTPHGYTVHVRPPGITSESLRVEVSNNNLSIYYLLSAKCIENTTLISCVIRKLTIPYDVDIANITAHYEGKELKVVLPYNELADGYHKEVQIFTM